MSNKRSFLILTPRPFQNKPVLAAVSPGLFQVPNGLFADETPNSFLNCGARYFMTNIDWGAGSRKGVYECTLDTILD